jgi:hypothetical protein
VASSASSTTLGAGAAVGVGAATNTSHGDGTVLRLSPVFTTSAANSTSTGTAFDAHAASGFSLNNSAAAQTGSASGAAHTIP